MIRLDLQAFLMRILFHTRSHIRMQSASRGFTMVELILVIVIVGILSAIAIPRFTARTEFDARGFYDQTLNMVRYAQKTAIAQRRKVWVQVGQAERIICLTYVKVSVDCQSDGGAPVYAPGEQSWFVRTAPADVSLSLSGSPPTAFAFDPLGRPDPNVRYELEIKQNGSITVGMIQVEAETGYVH